MSDPAEARDRSSDAVASSSAPAGAGPVLVTGAAGALGGSVVDRLVAAGRRVMAVDVDGEPLRELAGRCPEGAVTPHPADLTDPEAVVELFDAFLELCREAGGRPGVAHLVGGFRYAPLAETTDDDWAFLWKVNVHASFLVFREAARRFREAKGGSLVAVSAPAAMLGEAGVGPYAATKAAVLRMVESLARETADAGGRANAVLPGTMDTPANRRSMPDADPSDWVTTEAVAAVIHFLLDGTPGAADGGAVNGAAVRVPGPTL